ncbi:MAG: class II histone deacetylase [Sphingobium sp.]
MTTAFLTDERTFWHTTGLQALVLPIGDWVQPPNGAVAAETPDSKRRFLSLAAVSGILEKLSVSSAPSATLEDLLRVHDAGYLQKFREVSDAGGGEVGDYAPFGKGSFEIAKLSAGLAIEAVDRVLTGKARNAYALCRPPGHHCLADRGMGFCLLANIPIAIEAARSRHGVKRVAVVDWDVHHGNGTQSIYYECGDTLTISLHQENCFPPGYSGGEERGAGAGAGANLNISLPPGCGDRAYRAAVDEIVIPALEAFQPELLIVANGMDAGAADPLARMLLHSETYRYMTSRMVEAAGKLCDDRLVIVHEGGYSEASVPFFGLAILEALSGERTPVEDPTFGLFDAQQPTSRTLEFQLACVREIAAAWKASRSA